MNIEGTTHAKRCIDRGRQLEDVRGGQDHVLCEAAGTVDADAYGVPAQVPPAGPAVAAMATGDVPLAGHAVARGEAGDLAAKKTFPSLFKLYLGRHLPHNLAPPLTLTPTPTPPPTAPYPKPSP